MLLYIDVGTSESGVHSLADLVAGNDDLGMTETEIVASIAADGFCLLGGGAAPVVVLYPVDDYRKPVTSDYTAKAFLVALHHAGLMYHPEDRASDCLSYHHLPSADLATIQSNMSATFRFLDDPCEMALTLINMES